MMLWTKPINWPCRMHKPDHFLIIGTRPEAIKCAPLVRAFERWGARERLVVVFSGQQNGLLESAAAGLEPDLRATGWPHGARLREQRASMVPQLVGLLRGMGCGPHTRVLVQGDTSTTYFASLAAQGIGADLHHVEAGLRSGSITAPFPEEFNRRAIARLAHTHYAPTMNARENLLREGVAEASIVVTGNTGIDNLSFARDPLLGQQQDTVLITLHRRENRGERLNGVMGAVRALAIRFPRLRFDWVGHSHPDIHTFLSEGSEQRPANLRVLPPLAHNELMQAAGRYAVIMTDSGGLQEEATHLGIPLMILRDRTERPEAVRALYGVLCPPADVDRFATEFERMVGLERSPHRCFGTGDAADRIVGHLLSAGAEERPR